MKRKHYFLLLLIVATLLISCPVNQSSPTPSTPDVPVVPQEPDAPTTDVDGEVAEKDIADWKDALSALVHCYSKVNNSNEIYQEYSEVRRVSANKDVEIPDTSNNIFVTYNKGSYFSYKYNNRDNNKWDANMYVSGKYSNESFTVSINDLSGNNEGGSLTYTGTAAYTKGSSPYNVDMSKVFLGGYGKDSSEYKVNRLMVYFPYDENVVEEKYTFTNYNHPSGYTFEGKTVGVGSYTKDSTNIKFVSDQEKTDGEVSVTIPNKVEQNEVKLIVRYDIKREGDSKTITEGSYMQVKKEGEEKFRKFPLGSLTLIQQSNPVPQEPSEPTTDIDGNVAEEDVTAWKDALSALVYNKVEAVDDNKALYEENRSLREVIADTDVVLQDPSNTVTIPVTYYKGSYMSDGWNSIEENKETTIFDVSGQYKESGELFTVYINFSVEDSRGPSPTIAGTATYTEGSKTYKLDLNKLWSVEPIEDKNSPEYKVRLIIGKSMPIAEIWKEIRKYTFTNYNHPSGYIFDGKTAGVSLVKSPELRSVSDQEYTDGDVSVTIPNEVEGEVNLIVRYDIMREGEPMTIAESSYMHVKRVRDEKFRVFPLAELTL